MAPWTPTFPTRTPKPEDPRIDTDVTTTNTTAAQPIGPRRAAREALEAAKARKRAEDLIKQNLLKRVSFFADFDFDERDAMVDAMRRVHVRQGDTVMTHLPMLQRQAVRNSIAGRTSANMFTQAFLKERAYLEKERKEAKADGKKLKLQNPKTKTERKPYVFNTDDAWYVLAEGSVDVHVSVTGVGVTHGGVTGESRPTFVDTFSRITKKKTSGETDAKSNWRRAFSKTKTLVKTKTENDRVTDTLPISCTLHLGSFFGDLDDIFQCDPNSTVVVKAACDAVLFAVPREYFRLEELKQLQERKTKYKRKVLTVIGVAKKQDSEISDEYDSDEPEKVTEEELWVSIKNKVKQQKQGWSVLVNELPIVSSALSPFQLSFLCSNLSSKEYPPFSLVCQETMEGTECVVVMDGDLHATACVAGEDEDDELEEEEQSGQEQSLTDPKPNTAHKDFLDSEIWKRSFAPGQAIGECALSFKRSGLVWEANVRAGMDGAEVCFLQRDKFRNLFQKSSDAVARFELLVDKVAEDNTYGRVGLVVNDMGEGDLESTYSSHSSPQSHRSYAQSQSVSGRSSKSRSSKKSKSPRTSNAESSEPEVSDDEGYGTPATPSPRRLKGRTTYELLPPSLIPLPRKHERRGYDSRNSSGDSSGDALFDTDVSNRATIEFPEEWETDSDTEREIRAKYDKEFKENAALRTVGALRVAGKERREEGALKGGPSLKNLSLKWQTKTKESSDESSQMLQNAFTRARTFSILSDLTGHDTTPKTMLMHGKVIQKPLRRRKPLGPPPNGIERVARLISHLERDNLFHGCEMRILRQAVKDLELLLLKPGQTVYAYGSKKRDYIYVVEAGEVEAVVPGEDVDRDIGVGANSHAGGAKNSKNKDRLLHRTGSVFGADAIVYKTKREHTVVATERGAKLWAMRARWFERLQSQTVARRRDVMQNVLTLSPLFSELPLREKYDLVELIAELGEQIEFEQGDVVVAQNDLPHYVYIVTKGTCVAQVSVPEESFSWLEVGRFCEGSVFGFLEFLVDEANDFSTLESDDAAKVFDPTCSVRNFASVVAVSNLTCVVLDGRVFQSTAKPGSELRQKICAQRSAFASGVV